MTFAKDSMGVEEAREVFPVVLPSLENLCVKDTRLSNKGLRPLSASIKEGKASSLLSLKLENVDLNHIGLNTLSTAISERPLKIETLSLCENVCLGNAGYLSLHAARLLGGGECPSVLRTLSLRLGVKSFPDRPSVPEVLEAFLSEILKAQSGPKFEILDLDSGCDGKTLMLLGDAIRRGNFGCVRKLSLVGLASSARSESNTGIVTGSFMNLTSALCVKALCRLSELTLRGVQRSDIEILGLVGEAIQLGHLPELRVFEVTEKRGGGIVEEGEGGGLKVKRRA
uniref:Uncharacterized protein n=1 Tax=Chromera velia CCMP2878 TaxID=1169474 RepID=A0A0G4IBV8_9ALVE|eukprot:Cvel_12954.t1-p1 / transcript=Cvel_12954.t1 / gene=Cvel_12954 / organism=Chromera_velia_CCMP2878 / gene_product=hypothetical protein / transcript_product=hypothetical protein / location=Cvel_scaffold867:10797-12952(+) / protein_length=283 / sequence_SO=supercontig / SO=protein_coding / is_pseudo=false